MEFYEIAARESFLEELQRVRSLSDEEALAEHQHRTIHGQTIITFGNHLMSDSSLWESPFSTLYGRLPNTSLGPYHLGDADEIDNW
nr:hypothetical protein [Candidatus Saccharibacteria bacterium]